MIEGAIETIRQTDYKLIIFDCDGTLIDSEHLSCNLIGVMLRELGIDITNEAAHDRFNGTSFMRVLDYVGQQRPGAELNLESAYRLRIKEVFENELKPIEGVIEFIEQLSVAKCVASNAPKEKMAVTLPICKLDRFFPREFIFSAYDREIWKPDPDLFLTAAKQMGVVAEDCLVIEDSVSGAQAALNAEMDVIVYRAESASEFELEEVPIFHSYHDLGKSFLVR